MRRYYVYIGSSNYFSKKFADLNSQDMDYFLELVKKSDAARNRKETFDEYADVLIVPNHNYHGIVDTAHDRLGPLIEELSYDDATVLVHNPPRVLLEYLQGQKINNLIELTIESEKYCMSVSSIDFLKKMEDISTRIVGQNHAIEEISKSMWYLSNASRKKPYVVMLYGNSSLGKTALVKEIALEFYNKKYYEKHLSMFKNNTYSDYFFGESPNRKSLGYDLLERESNLLFFDELDKCPEHFYSAFYTLFDNTIFKDATYDANIDGLFIVCTSNFQSEEDIKKYLGLPIYYRINKFIEFNEFSAQTIYTITMNEILSRKNEYDERVTPDEIYKAVSPFIKSKGENARTIKQKVQKVVEELLFLEVKNKLCLSESPNHLS